jgi:hypothetical protein
MTRSIARQFERAQYYGVAALDNVVFRTDYPYSLARRARDDCTTWTRPGTAPRAAG